jgi:LemA protein
MKRVSLWKGLMKMGLISFIILAFFIRADSGLKILPLGFLTAGLSVVLVALYERHNFYKLEKIIFKLDRQPISSTAMATEGMPYCSEGVIVPTRVITSPVSKKACVYYHVVRERLESQGKTKKWIVRENIMHYKPFYIKDEHGELMVDLVNMDHDFSDIIIPLVDNTLPNPKHSEIDAARVVYRKEYKVERSLAFDEKWRVSEYILEPEQKVFAYGMVFKENHKKVLRESRDCPLIISRKSKDRYVEEFFSGPSLWYSYLAILVIGATLILFALSSYLPGIWNLGLVVLAILIIAVLCLRVYNRLVLLRNRMHNAASEIKIHLKKRHDMIPKLVEVVEGYAKHEKEVNLLISDLRKDLMFYPLENGENQKSLIAVLESYPKLRANENFKSLMLSLEDTEESIAQVREVYNRAVLKYKNLCEKFPTSIIAGLAGVEKAHFLGREELGL